MKLSRKPTFILSALIGGAILTSCAAEQANKAKSPIPMAAPMRQEAASKAVADNAVRQPAGGEVAGTTPAQAPQPKPQLIKTANLALTVESIEKTIETVNKLVQQKQGDILSLQDYKPKEAGTRHTASLQMRIPQAKLETTLDELSVLGTVESRTIQAEDVTNQLVDSEARLRNLRKQEATLLKIMERSGSVGDVLKVANELSNVRQYIEQIDAQIKNLRNQVAYSTINLQLADAALPIPAQRPLEKQLGETWEQATSAVSGFTTVLIKLCLWLVAFSPYLLAIAAAIYLLNRLKSQRPINKSSQ